MSKAPSDQSPHVSSSPCLEHEASGIADRWYSGITRYQWTVLVIACLGWIFDVFEGQIFVASMQEAMPSLTPADTPPGRIALYNNLALGAFLLGGALGGIAFGMLGDRIGRKRVLSLTILFYSFFTCLSALSQQWWHLAGFRFLVALGVGGEWAVASSLVAEVFPKKARAHVGGIFHASSVLGTYLAVAAGTFLIGNTFVRSWIQDYHPAWLDQFFDPSSLPWRMGFVIGVFPALLIVWIRRTLVEPESWQAAHDRAAAQAGAPMGAIDELFRGDLLKHSLIGSTLAAVGLATFWGAHIYGKNMLQDAVLRQYVESAAQNGESLSAALYDELAQEHAMTLKRWEMLGMFLVTTGGGLGLLSFGPLCQRVGRRGAFFLYQVGGLISALLVFQIIHQSTALLIALPIFGFLTLGMHAGYAIYFPELFPTRLRGTGTGFCFNAGRILAAPLLFVVGWVHDKWDISLANVASILSLFFLLGIAILPFAPETAKQELPE